MSAVLTKPPAYKAIYCPECLQRGKKNVIIKAEPGARVQAFCWHCKFRKDIVV